MKKLAVLLLALSMTLALAAMVSAQIFPVYEIPTTDLPDLRDGSLDDWEAVLSGTSWTQDDFLPLAVGYYPEGMWPAWRGYMGWHAATQTLWVGVERVDDVYINTYPGGEPQNMWAHDGMDLMVDGDHSGGDYNGFPGADYGEEMARAMYDQARTMHYFCPYGFISEPAVSFAEKLAEILPGDAPALIRPDKFTMADMLAEDYNGGYWQFHSLGNGGFFMAPDVDRGFEVSCENGFEGTLSADALGITACLYSYSHLSFREGAFAETCAEQYHLLREYAMDHVEAGAILAACD